MTSAFEEFSLQETPAEKIARLQTLLDELQAQQQNPAPQGYGPSRTHNHQQSHAALTSNAPLLGNEPKNPWANEHSLGAGGVARPDGATNGQGVNPGAAGNAAGVTRESSDGAIATGTPGVDQGSDAARRAAGIPNTRALGAATDVAQTSSAAVTATGAQSDLALRPLHKQSQMQGVTGPQSGGPPSIEELRRLLDQNKGYRQSLDPAMLRYYSLAVDQKRPREEINYDQFRLALQEPYRQYGIMEFASLPLENFYDSGDGDTITIDNVPLLDEASFSFFALKQSVLCSHMSPQD
jgi:hypothetical protein